MAKSVARRGFARERVLDAAVALFAEHGVNGTSLQMIANRLGVGKAAVYYQFHSKDEIALTVIQPVFDDMARLVTIAEALASAEAQRDVMISGLVELSVRHRRLIAVFHGDPAIDILVRTRDEFSDTIARMEALLIGPDSQTADRVLIALVVNGIYGSVTDPQLGDVSDSDLRRTLLDCSQRLLRSMAEASP